MAGTTDPTALVNLRAIVASLPETKTVAKVEDSDDKRYAQLVAEMLTNSEVASPKDAAAFFGADENALTVQHVNDWLHGAMLSTVAYAGTA